jgi:hypothetical protein
MYVSICSLSPCHKISSQMSEENQRHASVFHNTVTEYWYDFSLYSDDIQSNHVNDSIKANGKEAKVRGLIKRGCGQGRWRTDEPMLSWKPDIGGIDEIGLTKPS